MSIIFSGTRKFLRRIICSDITCTRVMSSNSSHGKPPNILVQTVPANDYLVKQLEKMVKKDRYVVYPVTTDLLQSSSSWRSNTRLLVLQDLPDKSKIESYLSEGGQILDFSATNETEMKPEFRYLHLDTSHVDVDKLKLILQEEFLINVEDDEERTDSRHHQHNKDGFLIADPKKFHDLMSARTGDDGDARLIKQNNIVLDFSDEKLTDQVSSDTHLHIRDSQLLDPDHFDQRLYLDQLKTGGLGRVMVYVPVISSSMTLFDGESLCHGFTVVPGRQSSGQGRGGNKWLSPPGCSMFSMQITLVRDSFLSRRPSLIQHLIALAHVEAIRGDPDYQDIDIRIKWPNDIYLGSSVKLGGVIAKSSVSSSGINVVIGAGVNLDNDQPTVSINQILREAGKTVLKKEEYLARVFNTIEDILVKCSSGQYSELETRYYKYWLHTHQQIRVQTGDDETGVSDARVVGIDEFGFLRVEDCDGQEYSVMDDGNSFDMMQGLVRPKARR